MKKGQLCGLTHYRNGCGKRDDRINNKDQRYCYLNISATCNLSDTLESVVRRILQNREGYFVYNDKGKVLSCSNTL